MNVFIYYKTLTIHRDNYVTVAIIFQKTNLLCQDRDKCLQLLQYVQYLRHVNIKAQESTKAQKSGRSPDISP